jgi:hypothetical protein
VYTQINKDDALVLLVGYTKPNNSHLDLEWLKVWKRVALDTTKLVAANNTQEVESL